MFQNFIGWHDADLSDKGVNEAKTAGKVIKLILNYHKIFNFLF